jgi:serine/threonine protein phosphatase PrpC
MIAVPYIHEPIPITPDLKYAVIASDGVWDKVAAEDLPPLADAPADQIAMHLINQAIEANSQDNITAIVVKFR